MWKCATKVSSGGTTPLLCAAALMACGQAMAEGFQNAPLRAQLCLFIIICFMAIWGWWAGGPRLSWVLGMLCKEKSHCFHCEILPQATYECSREDIHHFQQNSWQIHLLLLVILGAIFKCLSNVHSYSASEKPSSFCMTMAREGDNKLLL